MDDWGLDGLDENVAMWGTLETVSGKWSLTLEAVSYTHLTLPTSDLV